MKKIQTQKTTLPKIQTDYLEAVRDDLEIVKSIDLAQAELLNKVELDVTVSLAQVSLSMADVLDLLPGQVVSLPENLGDILSLYVGDQLVGTAKLVHEAGNQPSKNNSRRICLQIVEVI